MKCIFQDCQFEATKIVPCKIGMAREHMDVPVCKVHYDLLFDKPVKVSMELKGEY